MSATRLPRPLFEGVRDDLFSLAIRNELISGQPRTAVANFAHRAASAGIRSIRSRKAEIAHHYDLRNDFLRLWLDESLTYSCAYFRTPTDTLEQAQQDKLDPRCGNSGWRLQSRFSTSAAVGAGS